MKLPTLPESELLRGNDTRVLLAIVNGARTLDEIVGMTGIARPTAYDSMLWLRECRLVTWEPVKAATLRALVAEQPITHRRRRRRR